MVLDKGHMVRKTHKYMKTKGWKEEREFRTSVLCSTVAGLCIAVYALTCSPLDGFDVKVLLLARGEVWPHDAHLQASGHTAREHTTEGVETTLVAGWHHLRNIHHQRSLWIAVLNA